MTADDFQSAYDEWRRQLRLEGKPPLSIAHFAAAICTAQEDQLAVLQATVAKVAKANATLRELVH